MPTAGQPPVVAAQAASGQVTLVFRERGSGLRDHHPGLDRVLAGAGQISVVRVPRGDRLARFGSARLRQLLEKDGVLLEVAHPKGLGGGLEELLEDITALAASFTGRVHGVHSKEAQRRLLVQAQQGVSGDDRSPRQRPGVVLTATASCRAFCGQDGLSSDALGRAALAERVGWLLR